MPLLRHAATIGSASTTAATITIGDPAYKTYFDEVKLYSYAIPTDSITAYYNSLDPIAPTMTITAINSSNTAISPSISSSSI